MAVILGLALLLSTNRRAIRLRVVAPAFVLQAGFALLVLGTSWGRDAIGAMSHGVSNLLGYAKAGVDFISLSRWTAPAGTRPPGGNRTPARASC